MSASESTSATVARPFKSKSTSRPQLSLTTRFWSRSRAWISSVDALSNSAAVIMQMLERISDLSSFCSETRSLHRSCFGESRVASASLAQKSRSFLSYNARVNVVCAPANVETVSPQLLAGTYGVTQQYPRLPIQTYQHYPIPLKRRLTQAEIGSLSNQHTAFQSLFLSSFGTSAAAD